MEASQNTLFIPMKLQFAACLQRFHPGCAVGEKMVLQISFEQYNTPPPPRTPNVGHCPGHCMALDINIVMSHQLGKNVIQYPRQNKYI
jgi:hypothetical protein